MVVVWRGERNNDQTKLDCVAVFRMATPGVWKIRDQKIGEVREVRVKVEANGILNGSS